MITERGKENAFFYIGGIDLMSTHFDALGVEQSTQNEE